MDKPRRISAKIHQKKMNERRGNWMDEWKLFPICYLILDITVYNPSCTSWNHRKSLFYETGTVPSRSIKCKNSEFYVSTVQRQPIIHFLVNSQLNMFCFHSHTHTHTHIMLLRVAIADIVLNLCTADAV